MVDPGIDEVTAEDENSGAELTEHDQLEEVASRLEDLHIELSDQLNTTPDEK
jgi:hypothetical protein